MMKKTYKNLIIIICIINVLCLCTNAAFAAKTKGEKVKKSIEKEKAEVVKKKFVKKARSEIKYIGFQSNRDPFAPPKEVAMMLLKPEMLDNIEKIETVKMPKADLQGIIWSKNMPQAIINGSVMKVGEYIGEFQIKEITRKGVVLFLKGKDYLMKMESSKIKKK